MGPWSRNTPLAMPGLLRFATTAPALPVLTDRPIDLVFPAAGSASVVET
jgi:hypothetical protein